MSLITLPYTFASMAAGNIPAADIDDNFNAILTVVNGGIDQTNLSASFNPTFSGLTVNGAASISSTLSVSGVVSCANATLSGQAVNLGQFPLTGGSQQLPSGLIIKWGVVATTGYNVGTTAVNANFPVAFPNSIFQAFATPSNTPFSIGIPSASASGLTIDVYNLYTSNISTAVYWFAIGD